MAADDIEAGYLSESREEGLVRKLQATGSLALLMAFGRAQLSQEQAGKVRVSVMEWVGECACELDNPGYAPPAAVSEPFRMADAVKDFLDVVLHGVSVRWLCSRKGC